MTPTEVERFRALLEKHRLQIVDDGNEEIEPNRGEVDMGDDEDSQPLNEMNQVIASKRNLARAGDLRLIVAALTKIRHSADDFGFCEECDDPIPSRRLELMPWARYCVKCQSALEDPRRGRRKHLRDYS